MNKIFGEIRLSVEKEAEQMISRAKRVAQRELEHAEREATEIEKEISLSSEKEALKVYARHEATFKIEMRKKELSQREQFVREVMAAAMLKFIDEPRYPDWLERMVVAGRKQFLHQKPKLCCNAKDLPIVTQIALKYDLPLAESVLDITGGVILISPDGRISVDCSLKTEFARIGEDLRNDVVEHLNLNFK